MTRNLFPQILPVHFPDPLTYDFPEWVLVGEYFYHAVDVVSFGTPLTVETVKEAYLKGIFPWYMRGIPLPWYCPEKRAVLDFNDLHISRSLAKEQRKTSFTFTIDRDFERVINGCAVTPRPDQAGTWITADFLEVYTELHRQGTAHSVEVWDVSGDLVGGLYGIDAGGVFCGESMFHRAPNASKLALLYLIDHVRSRGSTWLDSQVMTPHMESLGTRNVPRERFLGLLAETQTKNLVLFGEQR